MDIVKVYPLDAVYDSPEDVPEDVISYFTCIYLFTLLIGSMIYILILYFRSNRTKDMLDHQTGLLRCVCQPLSFICLPRFFVR